MFLPWIFCGRFFVLHSFLCKEHKNQKGDMTFCVVYTEICVSVRLVTTKSVWKYRTEWNFEKRISDSGPSKHAWILVYSSRIKFYSHPQNPGNVPCKLHEKPCKVHGFRCSLHTSRTCTYCLLTPQRSPLPNHDWVTSQIFKNILTLLNKNKP